jgi:hypothetical protein
MDVDWIKKHYLQTQKLLNYRKFIKYIVNKPNNAKRHILNKKINYIQNILAKFGITHEDNFAFSIESGVNIEGKKLNKKDNPNMIDSSKYNEISKEIGKMILSNDFRQVFELPKLKSKEISDKAILECIKSVIGEYGFEINIISNIITSYEDNKKINKRENSYYIDLNSSIIEIYNKEIFDIVDEIESVEIDF